MTRYSVICLMGPTASGKTEIAMKLADTMPADIVSVDSALVYRGMDIGTAKPNPETLRRYPHRLVDIREPEQSYSAGDFVRDAREQVREILDNGRVPLLVGGTMLYFRALIEGIAQLPEADPHVRTEIDREAADKGWPALHEALAAVDPGAAERINPNDSQRIQRALEVFRVSGKTITEWQKAGAAQGDDVEYLKIALVPEPRAALHSCIEQRLKTMIELGFVSEVRALMRRPQLTAEHSSMRAVGYRQIWAYLEGDYDFDTAEEKALAATRQLAKRQLTWLRSEQDLFCVNPLEVDAYATISAYLRDMESTKTAIDRKGL